jgi:hypothetical protein
MFNLRKYRVRRGQSPALYRERAMRKDLPAKSQSLEQRAGHSKLLSRLYRDVGLAAVAAELALPLDSLESDLVEAVERGASLLAPQRKILAA